MTKFESNYATSWELGNEEHLWWTGWLRHHWPADVIRPGLRIYLYGKKEKRIIALAKIVRGGAFTYDTRKQYLQESRKLMGKVLNVDAVHWDEMPFSKNCVGLIATGKIIKHVSIRYPGTRFPQLGFVDFRKISHKHDGVAESHLDNGDLFPEGDRRLQRHTVIERNSRLRVVAKTRWRDKKGRIVCTACGFNFETVYGERGRDFIEMHHILPFATTKKPRRSRPEDLVPVCSNCHRIIHRDRANPLTLDQLKSTVRKYRRQR